MRIDRESAWGGAWSQARVIEYGAFAKGRLIGLFNLGRTVDESAEARIAVFSWNEAASLAGAQLSQENSAESLGAEIGVPGANRVGGLKNFCSIGGICAVNHGQCQDFRRAGGGVLALASLLEQ